MFLHSSFFTLQLNLLIFEIIEVINTHLHLDHCFGDNYVKDKYGVKVAANIGDSDLGADITSQMRRFGGREAVEGVTIDVPLEDGDVISVGKSRLEVITVPGHSPGGIALYSPDGHFVIAGDSLFRRSIGRTDLPGGSMSQLLQSIKSQLLTLPASTLVRSGHGPATTIAEEQRSNPYF